MYVTICDDVHSKKKLNLTTCRNNIFTSKKHFCNYREAKTLSVAEYGMRCARRMRKVIFYPHRTNQNQFRILWESVRYLCKAGHPRSGKYVDYA